MDYSTKTLDELNQLYVTHDCKKSPETNCEFQDLHNEMEGRTTPVIKEDIRILLLEMEKIQELIVKSYFLLKQKNEDDLNK